MTDLYTEWQKLCEEHEAARDVYFEAFAPVHQKFIQVFQGTSSTNPSDEELSQFETAWEAWQDVKRRMDEFIKANI